MVIRIRTAYTAESLLDLEQFAKDFSKVAFELFKESGKATEKPMLAELRYTPPRRPWEAKDFANDASRRAFFAKTGGKPYQRTGQYAAGWRVTVTQTKDGGQMVVSNSASYGKFVGGSFDRRRDFQQRGHKRTGWPRSAATADFWIEATNEEFEKRLARYIDDELGRISSTGKNR